MIVHHGFYLIFYISDKTLKMTKVSIKIWITAIFVFSCIVAIKIAVFVAVFCSYKDKREDFG